MDAIHFDALTRRLTGGSTRRALLTALTGGLFGMVSLVATAEEVVSRKRRKKKRRKRKGKCKGGQKTCNGTCVAKGRCCDNADCNGGVCEGGVCDQAPFQGICTAAQNFCEGSSFNCAPNPETSECNCLVRLNGLSYCAGQFFCFACSSDAQCVTQSLNPAAVCVQGNEDGPPCNCGAEGGTACAEPCPGVA